MSGTSLLSLGDEKYPKDAFAEFKPEPGFSIGNARAMIWLSQLAYETRDRDKLARIFKKWDAELRGVDAVNLPLLEELMPDISVVVAVRGDAVLVACPGTEPFRLRNWIRNFDFLPDPDTDVHTGFEQASNELWGRLTSGATLLDGPALYFAGHSLGGALAVLLARTARDAGKPVRGVYTFGMPRVGGQRFADGYNTSDLVGITYRLAYGQDLVSRTPPGALLGEPFRHVGRYLYSPDGRFDPALLSPGAGPDEPDLELDIRRTVERLRHFGPLDMLSLAASLRPISGPSSPYEGFLGAIIGFLPPPIRDHVPDRYWNALT